MTPLGWQWACVWVPLCRPHNCHHCGLEVDSLSTHGFNCRWSEGRHYRHAALNDIVHRALAVAKIPSCLEPSGLYRAEGKRPDGITLVPWKSGTLLVWDVTCPDTFAPSYSSSATREAGAVTASAEERKRAKYEHLNSAHTFTPVAIESSGVVGTQFMDFLRDLGHRLAHVTGEAKSMMYSSRGSLWQYKEEMLLLCWGQWAIQQTQTFFIFPSCCYCCICICCFVCLFFVADCIVLYYVLYYILYYVLYYVFYYVLYYVFVL